MNNTFELHATPRADLGKGASRRLRRAGQMPAIIYGAKHEPQSITFAHKDVRKAAESEAFFSHILTIHVEGKQHKAVVKDMQRHPYKPQIMHMDLLRINMNELMTMHVPLHFVGGENAPGVKNGGNVAQLLSSVEVTCLPAHLPEYISVDLSSLELNQMVHLSDLTLPEGVTVAELAGEDKNDLPVVHIIIAKEKAEKPEASEETGEAAPEEK